MIGLTNLLSDKNIKFSKLMLPSVQVAKKADAVKAEARGRMGERWEESATIKKEKATVSFRWKASFFDETCTEGYQHHRRQRCR